MKLTAKELTAAAVLTAVTCVLAPISATIGPVPISLGVLCIFLVGAILPPHLAFASVLVYIIIGSVGVPVFAGFKGGFQVLAGPTGGFLAAYPIMALIISLTVKIVKKRNILSLSVGMVIALLVCYLLGTIWFVVSMDSTVSKALAACVTPFVIFDVIKIVIAVFFALGIEKALKKAQIEI